ncbi:MAG TPA: glycosyltransferase family 2 protein [Terracidiphilus sp.]
MRTDIEVSVVVPCYNEQDVLAECHRRLAAVLDGAGLNYECIFVDDGSHDHTWLQLVEMQRTNPDAVVAVSLSRNFGHQPAVSAGLSLARGRAVVIIDADLQDPPELIPEMVTIWRSGSEVIYGLRESRDGESQFKLASAKLFYWLIGQLSDVQIPADAGDFRLIDRRVVDVMLSMPERHRLLRGICSWTGFVQTPLRYERAPRFAGTTKYPLKKMLILALDGIISFSTVPLRLLTLAGTLTAAVAFAGIVWALTVRVFTHRWVEGWTTLFIGLLFFSGMQMISLGIMGEYIGRIYTEVKQRPLFVIRDVVRA